MCKSSAQHVTKLSMCLLMIDTNINSQNKVSGPWEERWSKGGWRSWQNLEKSILHRSFQDMFYNISSIINSKIHHWNCLAWSGNKISWSAFRWLYVRWWHWGTSVVPAWHKNLIQTLHAHNIHLSIIAIFSYLQIGIIRSLELYI